MSGLRKLTAGGGQNTDRMLGFVAFVLGLRVPMAIPEIARRTGYSRSSAYRLVEQMRRHFPVNVVPGERLMDAGRVVAVQRRSRNG